MKYNKIILAGGNGYLGSVLAKHFSSISNEVIILSRKAKADEKNIKTFLWDGINNGSWTEQLDNADLLINLCGKNVNCRYNQKNREEIISSRILPVKLLNRVIKDLENPPKLWINITSATIYRHAEDRPQDETSGEIGYGFSIDVCKSWEAHFFETSNPKTRKITLRLGIVMGRSDGAFPRLLNLVKLGMGGKQGDGTQYVSWIHEQDVAASIEWLINTKEVNGIVNCTSPSPIKNTELMQSIRKAYGISFGLPAPAWLLEIGARIIGTETELILKSRWVQPAVLLNSNFKFQYGNIDEAIHDILSQRI